METLGHHQAIEKFRNHVEGANNSQTRLDAALYHVSNCGRCQTTISMLIQMVTSNEEDKLTCDECRGLLPEFVWAMQVQSRTEDNWRSVALHLATCPSCSQDWIALVQMASDDGDHQSFNYPEPDLTFLRGGDQVPRKPTIVWRLDDLGRLLIHLSAELLQFLEPPPLAYAVKSGAPGTIFELALNDAVDDLEISASAESDPGDPSHCNVYVTADIPSRGGWPNLAGSEIVLLLDGAEIKKLATDAYGTAVFKGIATEELVHLSIAISPPS